MDYSVWSILEQKIPASKRRNNETMKRALQKAWEEISVDTLANIVKNFTVRLSACVRAKGGHFENLL